jgi:hypothetical protein
MDNGMSKRRLVVHVDQSLRGGNRGVGVVFRGEGRTPGVWKVYSVVVKDAAIKAITRQSLELWHRWIPHENKACNQEVDLQEIPRTSDLPPVAIRKVWGSRNHQFPTVLGNA